MKRNRPDERNPIARPLLKDGRDPRGDDYFLHYPEVLRHASREEVHEAARRYLHPEHIAIVVVGEAAALVPQLRDFGPVEVHSP